MNQDTLAIKTFLDGQLILNQASYLHFTTVVIKINLNLNCLKSKRREESGNVVYIQRQQQLKI